MKRKGSRNVGNKLVTLLAAAVALTYFIYQLCAALMPLTTGTAVYYTSYDGIKTTGTIIRDERVLRSDSSGVRYFIVGDGEKVSKGGVIANVYSSQEDAQIYSDMHSLSQRIAAIEEVQAYNNTAAVDLDLLNTKIDEALLSVMASCQDGIYDDTAENSGELLKLLNRRKITTGEESDYSGVIAELTASYASLSASAPAAVSSVRSDVSGYFVSTADGYETLLTAQSVDTLTPETLENMQPVDNGEGAVGKIVSDYTWYIACTMSLKDSAAFKVGQTVKLKTALKSASELDVTVESINLGGGDDVAMVFACQNMNGDLATIRTIPITVITGEYSGLRVSNRAVRVVDGKTGVYVISGMQARFVNIDILRSTSGYTLCKMDQNATSDSLRLYDEVIEKGRNLYDGKIIR